MQPANVNRTTSPSKLIIVFDPKTQGGQKDGLLERNLASLIPPSISAQNRKGATNVDPLSKSAGPLSSSPFRGSSFDLTSTAQFSKDANSATLASFRFHSKNAGAPSISAQNRKVAKELATLKKVWQPCPQSSFLIQNQKGANKNGRLERALAHAFRQFCEQLQVLMARTNSTGVFTLGLVTSVTFVGVS